MRSLSREHGAIREPGESRGPGQMKKQMPLSTVPGVVSFRSRETSPVLKDK